ncbi:MAG TPA: hypothetical protein VF136_08595 [Methylomirabilota bacterium]
MLCATVAWAQTPQTQGEQRMSGSDDRTVTVVGCLQREADVPGRSPNMVERMGVGEDYILTNAELKEQVSAAPAGLATPTAFKVEGIDDTELQQHLNKRVEVTGTIDWDGDQRSDNERWRSGEPPTTSPGTATVPTDQPGTPTPGTTTPPATDQPGTTAQGTTTPPASGQPDRPGTDRPGTHPDASASPGVDRDLPEIEASSIREVPGGCD